MNDLYREAREEATRESTLLWTAFQTQADTQQWPEMTTAQSFWLITRIQGIIDELADALPETPQTSLATPPEMAPVSREVVHRLLTECWERRVVDIWLAAHLPRLASFAATCPEEEDSEQDYQEWIDKVEEREFVPDYQFSF